MISKKILGSLLVIGLVGAVAGTGTLAYFSDTETSEDNTFTAGALDLKLDWRATYNSDLAEESDMFGVHSAQEEGVNGPVTFFELGDVKPGDEGEVTVSLHNEGNPSLVSLNITKTLDSQGPEGRECIEPELEAQGEKCLLKSDGINSGGNPNDRGELEDNLRVRAWRDDGDNIYEPCVVEEGERVNKDPNQYKKCTDERTDQGDEPDDSNGANVAETLIYPNGDNVNGQGFTSIDHLASQNWKIDGDFDQSNGWTQMSNTDGEDYSDADGYVAIEFKLPSDTGNAVMTDQLAWSAAFHAVQARNNDQEGTSVPGPTQDNT